MQDKEQEIRNKIIELANKNYSNTKEAIKILEECDLKEVFKDSVLMFALMKQDDANHYVLKNIQG